MRICFAVALVLACTFGCADRACLRNAKLSDRNTLDMPLGILGGTDAMHGAGNPHLFNVLLWLRAAGSGFCEGAVWRSGLQLDEARFGA